MNEYLWPVLVSVSVFSYCLVWLPHREREERQMMVTAIALGGWTDASSTELESEDSVVFIPSLPPSLQKEACAPASNLELQLQLQVHVFKRGLPE